MKKKEIVFEPELIDRIRIIGGKGWVEITDVESESTVVERVDA